MSKPLVYSNLSYSPETLNSGKIWRFFVPHDLENWQMTLKNNRAPLLYNIKHCAAFQSHWYIQTGVTVQKRAIRVKIGDFVQYHLENWRMTLKNNRATLLCCFKLCASFHSHWWIKIGIAVRKCPIWVKINIFLACHLEIWRVTLKSNRAPIGPARPPAHSVEEVPYCFSRSYVKFRGHTAKKIVDFDPNWVFPDCNSSLNSPMVMNRCTKLEAT